MGVEIPKESGAGVIAGRGKPYLVKIRRELGQVKPEAEQIDGKVFVFREGWIMGEGDTSLYVGELAMVPNDFDWPADAPAWVAMGDLVPNDQLIGARSGASDA
jgi:hypothetical protein